MSNRCCTRLERKRERASMRHSCRVKPPPVATTPQHCYIELWVRGRGYSTLAPKNLQGQVWLQWISVKPLPLFRRIDALAALGNPSSSPQLHLFDLVRVANCCFSNTLPPPKLVRALFSQRMGPHAPSESRPQTACYPKGMLNEAPFSILWGCAG